MKKQIILLISLLLTVSLTVQAAKPKKGLTKSETNYRLTSKYAGADHTRVQFLDYNGLVYLDRLQDNTLYEMMIRIDIPAEGVDFKEARNIVVNVANAYGIVFINYGDVFNEGVNLFLATKGAVSYNFIVQAHKDKIIKMNFHLINTRLKARFLNEMDSLRKVRVPIDVSAFDAK